MSVARGLQATGLFGAGMPKGWASAVAASPSCTVILRASPTLRLSRRNARFGFISGLRLARKWCQHDGKMAARGFGGGQHVQSAIK